MKKHMLYFEKDIFVKFSTVLLKNKNDINKINHVNNNLKQLKKIPKMDHLV